MVAFISGVPSFMEFVVEFWVKGVDFAFCHPVRFFEFALNRRRIVLNHSSQTWSLSGQKRAYGRLKTIVVSVVECFEPGTRDILNEDG